MARVQGLTWDGMLQSCGSVYLASAEITSRLAHVHPAKVQGQLLTCTSASCLGLKS
jgi:hypothetical protein